ncbi:MAG: helix-turn-helix domain-containing protein [Lachnospiraceae bacterium]|nr:helix-turn-helix domain-containing protein [Lachnospiraceae bacterium]
MKEDTQKALLESDQVFASFLQRVRKERNIYLDQLAEGLMSASQLARIEKGQRPVHKNMRDRLLGRLGIASDLYENLLDIDDYRTWECQRNILLAVEQQETQKAHQFIEEYGRQKLSKDKLKQQFCLVMKAEVLKQQNAGLMEIGACYEKAVKLTVPDLEHLCLEKRLLSIQEVNMILEYEFYHKDGHFLQKCAALMTYVVDSVYDELSKVKIYPKIVYYYIREVFSVSVLEMQKWFEQSLQACNRAIEMLRNTGRAFYLIELLEEKCKLLQIFEADKKEYMENIEIVELFRNLYCEYDIPIYMQNCVHLYRQRWVFYIGDVLRIRRKMYGLTQEELCKGICVPKTLRRTEKMKRNMQQDMLGAMMRRLGLSKEYQRAWLVTNDEDVVRLSEELAICRNNFEVERARWLLNQIEKKISFEIPENRQYFIEAETSLDWMEGKIKDEEYAARQGEALRCTLDTEKLMNLDEIYLTEMEISCICKSIKVLGMHEKKEYIEFLMRYFRQYEEKRELTDCVVMYEFVMVCMASELGNMGDYQTAVNIDKKVLKEILRCRRIWSVSNLLYDILWNEIEQEKGKDLIDEKTIMTEHLQQCIILSHFYRQQHIEKFLCEKMNHV